MAIILGVDGFSVATDITRLTGAEYTADSMPTLAQVEEAIQDAFAIISARLVAVGLGEGPYDDDNPFPESDGHQPVSYTHLTLPTKA